MSHTNYTFKKGKGNSVQLGKVVFGIKLEQALHRMETVLRACLPETTLMHLDSSTGNIRPPSAWRTGPQPPLSPAGNAKVTIDTFPPREDADSWEPAHAAEQR